MDSEGIVDFVGGVQHVFAVWLEAIYIWWECVPVAFFKSGE